MCHFFLLPNCQPVLVDRLELMRKVLAPVSVPQGSLLAGFWSKAEMFSPFKRWFYLDY